ncbi:NAD(P)/FAD-dependent oxidoreductase [Paracraurococcus ruber]|uniref:FAD-dependent oxidoreductase n=1 Tax=Paracraurococcus ruber TaxID=77675 RepID=A0ABS1CRG5_9PROT|nr:FAD-binding oxidoreductase [Paracraurococcus ruber]MBK1657010.1 FAD-dependent oxidoreductase [Paracraurococcus ruber]TDG34294.1 FAD-binding oxidoreductase [Paracraurococcus ruber]
MTPEVIVVGGGLHGLSAALHIARRGKRVLVLEKDRVAAHASSYSAGGVRTLGRHMAEVPLAVESLALWHRIGDLVGDDCDFHATGHVKVAESAAELAELEARATAMRAAGWTHEEVVDRAGLRRLLPAVADHAVGGLVARDNGFARPYQTAQAFRRAAEAAGAEIREGAAVLGLDRRDALWEVRCADGSTHRAPVLVNTAGAWGARLARSVGEEIPLGFNAFMMIYTSALPAFVTPVVGLTGRPMSFKQAPTGHVMIGGGHKGVADLDSGRVQLDVERLAFSARTALDVFPILREARLVHAWAGIEGVLPDEIPVIGLSRTQPGLVHAFGFCGHGFELGPIMGGIVAQLALDGATNWPIAAFAPDRFATAAAPGGALLQPAG